MINLTKNQQPNQVNSCLTLQVCNNLPIRRDGDRVFGSRVLLRASARGRARPADAAEAVAHRPRRLLERVRGFGREQ